MAEDDVRRPLPFAVDDVEVRMADAGRHHPHGYLAGSRGVEQEVLLDRVWRGP